MEAFDVHRRLAVSQELHGDRPVVLQIVRQINGGHAAGAELALDTISIAYRCRNAGEVRRLGGQGEGRHVERGDLRRQNSVAKAWENQAGRA